MDSYSGEAKHGEIEASPLLSICIWTGKVRIVISYANHGRHNDEHLTDTRREPVVHQASDHACATVHRGDGTPIAPWTRDDHAP